MRILLINPPRYNDVDYVREGRCMQPKSVWNNIWPPLTLNYIATVLKEKNAVKLIDYIAEQGTYEDFEKDLKKFKPDMLIINNGIPSIKWDLKSAEIAKKLNKNIVTVTYGIFPTIATDETLNKYKIDFAIIGEPEITIKELAEKVSKKESTTSVEGLAYKKGKKIITNSRRKLINDIDKELGVPDRSMLPIERYTFPFDKKPFALLTLGRGCPYPCTFCVSPNYYGKKFRTRDPIKVVDEMEECYKDFGISNFMFWGESFTLKKEYGMKICDEILRRKLKFKWISTSRVDTLDMELLRKMKKSGCYLLGLGIETSNEEILLNIKKKTKIKTINKAIKMCKKAGIKTMGHFIFGFPGETKKTAEKTIKFSKKCGVDYAQFYCAVPYPKTEFWDEVQKEGYIETQNWDLYEQNYSVVRTKHLSTKEIMDFRSRAFKEFYFRPKKVFQHLKSINSFKEFINTIAAGLEVLKWFRPKKTKNQ